MAIQLVNHCIDFTHDLQNDGSILAVSNCAGGGHIEATKAICTQFFEQQNAFSSKGITLKGQFKVVDIFQGSFPPFLNKLIAYSMAYHWNKAKREGNIDAQEKLYNGKIMGVPKSILVEWILFIPVYLSTFFRLIFNPKITHVVVTQPLGLRGLIKAVRSTNFTSKRKIRISQILTDLPTDGSIHYSHPLKNLSDQDKADLRIITTKPLISDPKETEQQWWKRVYGLNYLPKEPQKSQVFYREFPLRPAFLRWRDTPTTQKPTNLEVKINSSEEEKLINKLLGHQSAKKHSTKNGKKIVCIPLKSNRDIVGLITIGSQAAKKTQEYVNDFIEVTKCLPANRQYTLFVACGRHEPGKKTLFQTVYNLSLKANLPSHIRVIPMGYQDDDELAPLMHRMDFGVGSTGGLTSFELIRTAKHKIYLHSEAKIDKLEKPSSQFQDYSLTDTQKQLLQGFSLWEKWNALYQIFEKQAEIVTPGPIFKSALNKLQSTDARQLVAGKSIQ